MRTFQNTLLRFRRHTLDEMHEWGGRTHRHKAKACLIRSTHHSSELELVRHRNRDIRKSVPKPAAQKNTNTVYY